MDDSVEGFQKAAIEGLRNKLIDTSKRNRLLNFKHSDRGASFVRVVDELPDHLFERLRTSQMGFDPLPDSDQEPADEKTPAFQIALEAARLTDPEYLAATKDLGDGEADAEAAAKAEQQLRRRVRATLGFPALGDGRSLDIANFARANGFNPSYDLPEPADHAARPDHQTDDRIRVLFTREQLDRRLRGILDRNRSVSAETGIHTLQIAFGFLEWRETQTSTDRYYAPLLLMPVNLQRTLQRGRYIYRLTGNDEDLTTNLALQELLRRNYNIQLPGINDDDTPEAWLKRLSVVIREDPRLLIRRFITFGTFPFPNMALWRDLDPEAWRENQLIEHPGLRTLLGATGGGGAAIASEDYPLDDEAFSPTLPPIVLPADASQHSALIDVVEGHDMVIDGPPGTGKSQTIANMIGAALAAGKRVLFLAEKSAALDVVAVRLRDRGFEPLMLELHSDRAQKSELMKGLAKRLESKALMPDALDLTRRDHVTQRDTLKKYHRSLQRQVGALGRTVSELIWRNMNLRENLKRQLSDKLARHKLDDAANVKEEQLKAARDTLDEVEAAANRASDSANDEGRSLWADARTLPTDPYGQDEVRDALQAVATSLQECVDRADAFESAMGVAFPMHAEAKEWLPSIGRLPDLRDSDVPGALTAAIKDPTLFDEVLAYARQHRSLSRAASELHPEPSGADLVQLRVLEQELIKRRLAGKSGQDIADLCDRHEKLDQTFARILAKCQMALRLLAGEVEPTVEAFIKLDSVLADISHLSSDALAIKNLRLVNDDATALLSVAAAKAEEIRSKEDQLSPYVRLEKLTEAGPGELKALADILSDTGFFGRLGRRYRTARRRADALLTISTKDRHRAAAFLREGHALRKQRDAFASNTEVAAVFGPRWLGYRSDFESAQQCAAALMRIRAADLSGPSCLDGVLAQPASLLAAIARGAQLDSDERHLLAEISPERSLLELERLTRERRDGLLSLIAHLDDCRLFRSAPLNTGVDGFLNTISQLQQLAEPSGLRDSDIWAWYAGPASIDTIEWAAVQKSKILESKLPALLVQRIHDADNPAKLIEALQDAAQNIDIKLLSFVESRDRFFQLIHATRFCGTNEPYQPWPRTVELLWRAHADSAGLRNQADLIRYLKRAEEQSLRFVFDAQVAEDKPLSNLADAYEFCLVRTLLIDYLNTNDAFLQMIGGETLEQSRKRYRDLDKKLQELEALSIVAKRLADSVPYGIDYGPKSGFTDEALIRNELGKKRNHKPIRYVVEHAHRALQALKPVWLMSPHAMAQYAPPGTASFDLIVIDEASQMRPEYAAGAIARAQQVVVVGDPMQLPPTDFFQTSNLEDDDDRDDAAIDTESILDLSIARLRHRRMLKWHYRSRHPSLIQFSNERFYDNRLVVFPAAATRDEVLGVEHVFVGGTYESHINRREAEAIVERAVDLIYSRSELSLGIATMNVTQRELIFQEFERIVADDDVVRAYVERRANTVEPFFVKNLENVQGDERDVILISTVYGPNTDGQVYQRFGPVNSKVGHRRLNVLFTRAKRAVVLVTSLRPDDIRISASSHGGVQTLQAYLNYAASGAVFGDAEGGEPDSDFEIFVADRLRAAGYQIVPQVGVASFRIDIGVRARGSSHLFLAGIECDGARYHSGYTVRDRDRIRQDILEGLGWHIYRIWSTDWFNNPDREMGRLLGWLQERQEALSRAEARKAAPAKAAIRFALPPPKPQTVPDVPRVAIDAEFEEQQKPHPHGQHRQLDDIDYYEVDKGYFEIWVDGRCIGEVERVDNSSVKPARLYGGRVELTKPRFRGSWKDSEVWFESDDIYQAIRRVARHEESQHLH